MACQFYSRRLRPSLRISPARTPCHQRRLFGPCPELTCRDSPRRARYFLVMRQESSQRSAPRLPGPAGCPRCGRPAGPVAKLAGQKRPSSDNATGLPPANLPRSAGQRGMKTVAPEGMSLAKMPDKSFNPFRIGERGSDSDSASDGIHVNFGCTKFHKQIEHVENYRNARLHIRPK